jgi:hypothetical protein
MRKTLLLAALAALVCGCSSVSTHINPYLGIASFPATDPAHVQILAAEPKDRKHDRLGEVFLDVEGNPAKATLEKKLRAAAANLGADAAFVVSDQTRIFPVVYVNYWGPYWTQDPRRGIVAVAIRFK